MNNQRLEIYQSLWAMEARTPGVRERTAEENFALIAQAGYAGVCLDPGPSEIEASLKLKPLFERHRLKCMITAFPHRLEDVRPFLQLARELDAPFVSLIGVVYPLTVAQAVPVVRAWIAEAEDFGMPIMFETHRDCITNDMFFTLELIDAIPQMRLCADLSHYVVGRELRLPLTPDWHQLFGRLLERSDCFQGRIASREQVQVPIDFPQHREWVELFKSWWAQGMRGWRERAANDAVLPFICELGPAPYAITDAHGKELSDRWAEALQIRRWVEELWEQ